METKGALLLALVCVAVIVLLIGFIDATGGGWEEED